MTNENVKEITTIIVAAVVLMAVVAYPQFSDWNTLGILFLSFILIIGLNVGAKKVTGYIFESKVTVKFWEMYRFGMRKDAHFKFPLPMIWLPLVLTLFSRGIIWFFSVLEFDVGTTPERASKRHGMYRYSRITEWHMAWIAAWGVIVNLILGIIAYTLNFEQLAKLSIYYATWSMVPFSSMDGTKIMFGSRMLYIILLVITLILLALGLSI